MIRKSGKESQSRDVSCIVSRMILRFAEMKSVAPERLLRKTGENLQFLFDTTNWTSEYVIEKLFDNLSKEVNVENVSEQVGMESKVLIEDEIFDLAFSVYHEPSVVFKCLPRWFACNFKILGLRIIKEAGGKFFFEIRFNKPKSPNNSILKWILGLMRGVIYAYFEEDVVVDMEFPDKSGRSRIFNVSVGWRSPVKKSPVAVDSQKIQLLLRKIIRKIDKLESRRVDVDRLYFLLKESEGRFRIFFDSVMESVLVIDEGGFVFEANRKALEVLKMGREELIGMPVVGLVRKDEEEMVMGLIKLAREGKPIPITEIEFINREGERVSVQASVTSIVWPESSAPFKIFLLMKDISLLRESQQEAQRMKNINELIVGSMMEGIFVEDANGYCVFANPRMEEMLGYESGELKGIHWTETVPSHYLKPIKVEVEKRRMGIANSYEAVLMRKDGSCFPVKISARPLFEEGKYIGVLSVVIDLSEIKKLLPADGK